MPSAMCKGLGIFSCILHVITYCSALDGLLLVALQYLTHRGSGKSIQSANKIQTHQTTFTDGLFKSEAGQVWIITNEPARGRLGE
ncbi:hypothetical protein F5Y07DRAFT_382585 [Xylaria sp. FL0933]|nr:hypothetical protein F5Y07DRAFT_382585 [Xylaria sp. FL0933]